jgi:hypothetical protein
MHGNRLDFNLLRAGELPRMMEIEDVLSVERIGGFGGFGLPSSHLKSRGELSTSELSAEELRKIDAMFRGDTQVGPTMLDGFRYRITRKIGNDVHTIEVPEEGVPLPIRNCVKDVIE